YLLDWDQREAVLVLDSSLGQDSLSLSSGFGQVVTLVPDSESAERVKELARHHGCSNILVAESLEDIDDKLFGSIRNVALHNISGFLSSARNPQEVSSFIEKVILVAHNATTFYVSGVKSGAVFPGFGRILGLLEKKRKERQASIRVLFEPTLESVSELIPLASESKDFLRVRPVISRLQKYGKYVWRGGKALGEGEFLYLTPFVRTFFEIIIEMLSTKASVPGNIRVDYIRKGNPIKVMGSLTGENGSGFIVRIPLNSYSNGRTKRAYVNMETIGRKYSYCGGTVPRTVGAWDVNGEEVYLEKRVEGRSVESRRSMDDPLYQMGVEWISSFHRQTMENRTCTKQDFMRLVADPIAFFALSLDPCGKRKMDRVISRLSDRLLGREFPFVFMHGDFKLENILFRNDLKGIAGIIDWDLGIEQGAPVVDILNLILFHRSEQSGTPYHKILEEMVRQQTFAADEWRVLKSYYESTGINQEIESGVYVALFWIFYVTMRTVPYVWSVVEWRTNNVDGVLDMLSDDEWWGPCPKN
ncbi:MAG: aminoglycoside phosphotransferase family protein, partial [Syntrophobacterales bacterium]